MQLPPVVAVPTAATFGLLSRLRRARVFHPHGLVLGGELQVGAHQGLPGSELLTPGRRARALVRISRGFGLPSPLPDLLGLAVRVIDAYGPSRHQDLLLVTSSAAPVGRRLLLPAARWDGRTYSTLLPYEAAGAHLVLGARLEVGPGAVARTADDVLAATRGPGAVVHLLAAPPLRPFHEVARIELAGAVEAEEGEALRFDPWRSGGGLRPVGLVQRLRAAAYPGSQVGRPDT